MKVFGLLSLCCSLSDSISQCPNNQPLLYNTIYQQYTLILQSYLRKFKPFTATFLFPMVFYYMETQRYIKTLINCIIWHLF
jgi:hypothetical protein